MIVTLVIVGFVDKTLLPVPVEVFHEVTVPLENKTVFAAPIAVRPVPPFATGSAEPEYPSVNVPPVFKVIGDPVTDKKLGGESVIVLLPRVVMSAPRARIAAVFAGTTKSRPVTGVYNVSLINTTSADINPTSVVRAAKSSSIAVMVALKTVDKFSTPEGILKSVDTAVINGVDQLIADPVEVRTCPARPRVVRPVPLRALKEEITRWQMAVLYLRM